jgi:hypothetical protein
LRKYTAVRYLSIIKIYFKFSPLYILLGKKINIKEEEKMEEEGIEEE